MGQSYLGYYNSQSLYLVILVKKLSFSIYWTSFKKIYKRHCLIHSDKSKGQRNGCNVLYK